MCVVIASDKDMCPYWVQELVIAHPFENKGNDLGHAEVFLTIALVVASEKEHTLTVYHKGSIDELQDDTAFATEPDHWWWKVLEKFPKRNAEPAQNGLTLRHYLPEINQRWAVLLKRHFQIANVHEVTWRTLPILKKQKEHKSVVPGLTTVWPHDPDFSDSEKLIKNTYGDIPFARIDIEGIPFGTWLICISFITSDGLYPMGPYDLSFPISGPGKMVNDICDKLSETDNQEVIRLMNTKWHGLQMVQWVSHAQYDVAMLSPEEFELSTGRVMFPEPEKVLPAGLLDINPTRSKYKRFSLYTLFPCSSLFEIVFRVRPRCYFPKGENGLPKID